MRYFDHPNVVRIYGVAAVQEPIMVVMELVRRIDCVSTEHRLQAEGGALDSYLKKTECLMTTKVEMCLQVNTIEDK